MSEAQENNPPEDNPELQNPDSGSAVDEVFAAQESFDDSDSAGIPDDVESLKNLLAEKSDQLLRSAAEIENVRKRVRREADEARKYASTGLLSDLLTVVDDLHRALESAEQNQEGEGLLAGVKMVATQLESVLEKHHCKKIDALGKPFDPNLHEAIQMQPSADYEANHVSLETRTGYQFHDRVLRTSQVFVSTGKPATETVGDSEEESAE